MGWLIGAPGPIVIRNLFRHDEGEGSPLSPVFDLLVMPDHFIDDEAQELF